MFVDFQRVPAKPQGDGGLDGLSHGQGSAPYCLAPARNMEPRKLEAKGLKNDIVNKFSGDLQKLFEHERLKRKNSSMSRT